MNNSDEPSESSEKMLRHEEREREFEPAFGDSEEIELITAHIGRHIGNPENVFHEFVSDLVHLDVHIVNPTEARNCYTLITSGMSSRAMKPHEEQAQFAFGELLLCLSPDWPLDDEAHQWPVDLLKFLARFPHEYETWLAEGHSLPNGDPPDFYPGTKMNAVLITTPRTIAEDFWRLKVNEEKTIHFWAVIPLFQDEMKFKLKQGAEALYARLAEQNVTELLDVNRKSTVKKFFGIP